VQNLEVRVQVEWDKGREFMKNHSFCAMALVLLLAMVPSGCQKAGVQAGNETTPNPGTAAPSLPVWDQDFLVNAQKAEIRQASLSRTALDRAYGPDVQRFAHMVVDDHTHTLQQLTRLMNKKGVSQPGTGPEANAEGKYRLDSLSGSAFDDEYISLMAAETQQNVERFSRAAETADDREVRAYASSMLPLFEREQQKAADLENKLSKRRTE
jgi:putative membrane protein